MKIDNWCVVDEAIYVAISDETFRQYAGLGHSEKVLKRLSSMAMQNAEIFVGFFSEPRLLYLSAIETIADAKTKNLELTLHRLRKEKIISSNNKHRLKNARVNWNTWRQFNSAEDDAQARKSVFDEFITKTRFIAPIIEKRFNIIRNVYEWFSRKAKPSVKDGFHSEIDPLSGYLESEGVTYSQLKELVTKMGEGARQPFARSMSLASQIIGRPPEYYDDFYYFRNRIYRDVEKPFGKVDPIMAVKRTLKSMGFDFSAISFDVEDRPTKYPSPICFFVKIPNDIRVLYKSESPYFDLQGCYHETGHAIHAASINTNLSYASKYKFPMGIAEIFSIFLERLTMNPLYLNSVLGISDEKILDKLVERNRFMELFFVTFYSANSLMKLEYWRKGLSIDQASELYERLIKKYTGFRIPGQYWMLHHILPEAIMYVPSYLMAASRAAELEDYLQDRFGEHWWNEEGAAKLVKEVMSQGGEIDLSIFSTMDQNIFMKEITDR
ncbi:MAG: M3 family metallopeptidase [Thermoproteota archaeon]|nr:M3 family metallopeptidase [Thermoproteota archaeon]